MEDSRPPSFKDDYTCYGALGEGSYSQVFLCKDKQSNQIVAIKQVSCDFLLKMKKVGSVHREKSVLSHIEEVPFSINLRKTFKDGDSLYFVFDHCKYGTLIDLCDALPEKRMEESMAAFYIAQLVTFLHEVHKKGVIHRDLKPENLMIDRNKHLRVIDFGDAKYLNDEQNKKFKLDCDKESDEDENDERRGSFVGTPLYVSPEMLNESHSGIEADYWALGCIIFRILFGKPAFVAETEHLTFEKILALDYQVPAESSDEAKDLISQFLKIDPKERLVDFTTIKRHPFFSQENLGYHLDFDNLQNMKFPFDDRFPDRALTEKLPGNLYDTQKLGEIVIQGTIKIRKNMLSKTTRLFTLSNQGCIKQYNGESLHKTLWLSSSTKVNRLKSEKQFDLVIDGKSHVLESENAAEWIQELESVIKRL